MAKLGVKLKIDVSKIDKERLFRGKSGVYLDATVFIDPENPGQYGDHGMITQDVSKEEKDQGVKGAILGNCKVFWQDSSQGAQYATQKPPHATQQPPQKGFNQPNAPQQVQQPQNFDNDDFDVPF